MRPLIAAAALIVNFAALSALDWSAHQAQVAPGGEVSIRQLADPAELSAAAEAADGIPVGYLAAKAL